MAPVSATTRVAVGGLTVETFVTLEERLDAIAEGRMMSEDRDDSTETLHADKYLVEVGLELGVENATPSSSPTHA